MPVKVKAVKEWPAPTSVFYRKFIRDFATIARPLTALTKKDAPWDWSFAAASAFQEKQDAASTAPVVGYSRSEGTIYGDYRYLRIRIWCRYLTRH